MRWLAEASASLRMHDSERREHGRAFVGGVFSVERGKVTTKPDLITSIGGMELKNPFYVASMAPLVELTPLTL